MLARHLRLSSLLLVTCPLLSLVVDAQVTHSRLTSRDFDPLGIDTPSPEDGPSISADALRDLSYLPAQIGGIVGAYAVSLVLVAITLLSLAKKRREHLRAANDEADFEDHVGVVRLQSIPPKDCFVPLSPRSIRNFSYPSPQQAEFGEIEPAPYTQPSPDSSVVLPGLNPFVDQRVVAQDKAMAQQQLEEMYKHVMEHEEAKQKGVIFDQPVYPGSRPMSLEKASSVTSKKEKPRPAGLNLSSTKEDRSSGSKTSSLLSALRSPKKKSVRGVSISSPIMTPQSATFPRQQDMSSMGSIAPRHYAPPPPPPVPTDRESIGVAKNRGSAAQIAPDHSPESTQSIDERLGSQLPLRYYNGSRAPSQVVTEADPESAVSEHSQAPLVGLPSSPKPGATFPTLPLSPKPGATFQRPNAPSAVRTGGSLPLRAYEPALASPSATPQTTKQTVFERKAPLSPMTGRTPGTGMPYSPYQPFTPCVPVTPSLVTKEDRKRMRKMTPKTPTVEMVKSSDELW
ncbi:hypothetical protein ACO1O0_001896 [Amphichorda felina]